MAEKQTAKRNRREEILQSLALMLESSDGSQRITTAKLAASVGVSEAALYRHFPSKTRMFDSLIEFIEDSLITRINLILKDEKDTTARLRLIVLLILGFGERNPGLTRILTGHALMFEQDRLQGRINQLFERIEAQLRQVMREKKCAKAKATPSTKPCWPASCWLSARACCRALCAASSNIVRRMISTPAGRWSPLLAVNPHMQPPGCMILLAICVSLSQIPGPLVELPNARFRFPFLLSSLLNISPSPNTTRQGEI